ncbi:hypothetical protein ACLB2K_074378 [Fragaria x ananassa]
MASESTRPHMPDLVIHKILLFLPTKSAVRLSFLSKQWEGVWCSAPILDFDEGGDENGNNNLSQHRRFVENILSRYLKFIVEEEKEKQGLQKVKLHMTRYLTGDASIVTKLLSSSFERGVKELDISLRVSETQWDHGGNDIENYNNLSTMQLIKAKSAAPMKNYYYFSRNALANAKSLTTLNFGYVRITNISSKEYSTSTCLLPSLKSMSLKTVHFDSETLLYLMHECPSIEYLSINSCCLGVDLKVSSSSLKSLQVEHCDCFAIRVDNAVNLESLAIISDIGPPQLPNFESIMLKDCSNLKRMNICAPQLKLFSLDGCLDVKGTVDAPLLQSFTFKGYLSSKFSVKAPNLAWSRIVLFDNWGREAAATFNSRPWNHFTTLSNFLKEFGSSRSLDLYVTHIKALMFPKDFRETLSSPIFPSLENFYFSVKNPFKKRNKELSDSLNWMAPDAQVIEHRPWRIRQGPF